MGGNVVVAKPGSKQQQYHYSYLRIHENKGNLATTTLKWHCKPAVGSNRSILVLNHSTLICKHVKQQQAAQ